MNRATPPPSDETKPRIRRRVGSIEARGRHQTMLRYVLLFVSAAFMTNAVVGDNGLIATIKARRQYAAVQRAVLATRLDNRRLLGEMNRLKHDPAAIEEVARKEHGLIRPGETLVIIKDAGPSK